MGSMAAMGGGHEDRDGEAGEHRDKDEAPGHGSSMTGTKDDGKTVKEQDHTDAMKPGEAARMAPSTEMPAMGARQQKEAHGAEEEEEPIDVYLMAMRFSYMPVVLRLEKYARGSPGPRSRLIAIPARACSRPMMLLTPVGWMLESCQSRRAAVCRGWR